jgi:hypothetical protein
MTIAVGAWRMRWGTAKVPVRLAVLLLAFSGVLFLGAGCASRQHQPAEVEEDAGIERPAVPLNEEEGLTDRIGEVGVVLIVVGITLGLIIIPLLFFL